MLNSSSLLTQALFAAQALSAARNSSSFDAREATIDSVHQALFSGRSSCHAVVSAFLDRIQHLNPTINAIISLNPEALSTANALDAALAAGDASGSLFCVPVLLKDNYDAAGMNTTAGCADLADLQPAADAPVVTALRKAGAVVLGKANLHELALEGLTVSSFGGQTINPYDSTRTPGGSSGGSAAAVAASFSVFATGTDTVNSLRSPASANSLFSVRPTRGLISRAGIIPISFTQDAAGPIGRTVRDVATALTVMASVGYDAQDNATALIPDSARGVDYTAALGGHSIAGGLRFGLVCGFFNSTASDETMPINLAMDTIVSKLSSAGAMVIPINDTTFNSTALYASYDTQRYEYRQEMEAYLQRSSLSGRHPRTLGELYNSSRFLVIPSEYEYVTTALVSSASNATYNSTQRGIQNLVVFLQETFVANRLDALLYPEQQNLVVKLGAASQYGRNGILAAVTGSPVVTVPIGFSNATSDAPVGVPIGMEILGRPWTEKKLLGIASEIEQMTRVRRMPRFAADVAAAHSYVSVPVVRPNNRNIPSAYPLGTL